jgi:hypothetical protein
MPPAGWPKVRANFVRMLINATRCDRHRRLQRRLTGIAFPPAERIRSENNRREALPRTLMTAVWTLVTIGMIERREYTGSLWTGAFLPPSSSGPGSAGGRGSTLSREIGHDACQDLPALGAS